MAIRCPKCGFLHDVAKLEEGKRLKCRCGFKINASLIETAEDFLRYCEGADERRKAGEIQHDAELISQMILDEGRQAVDVEIAKCCNKGPEMLPGLLGGLQELAGSLP